MHLAESVCDMLEVQSVPEDRQAIQELVQTALRNWNNISKGDDWYKWDIIDPECYNLSNVIRLYATH